MQIKQAGANDTFARYMRKLCSINSYHYPFVLFYAIAEPTSEMLVEFDN